MRRFATRRGSLLSALVLAFFLTASAGSAQAPYSASGSSSVDAKVVEGRLQIKLTEPAQSQVALRRTASGTLETNLAALDQLNAQFGVANMKRLFRPAGRHEARHRAWGLDRWYIVELAGPRDAQAAVVAYAASGVVEVAERQYQKSLHGERVELPEGMSRTLDGPPDDTFYGRQWHYDNDGSVSVNAIADADIDAPAAWAIETGHPDVIVQIVDSGIDSDHPDLVDALWVNAGEDANGNGRFDNAPVSEGGDLNGIDDDDNGFVDDIIGYNHADDLPTPEAGRDSEGGSGSHGVHTAGTVGARSNNGTGVAGVAGGDGTADSGVRLMISQTFGNTNVDGFAEAIVYAADMGAVIANHSWGYTNPGAFEQAVLDAIDYFTASAGGPGEALDGGLFVTSAGNSGSDDEWYPAFYEPTLSVSSLGVANQRSLFNSTGSSNFGTWVDVAGPGGDFATNNVVEELVLSTVIQGEAVNSGLPDYDYYQGTSMSSPHVAGIAALVASYEYRQGTTLTAAELRARVASPNTTKEIDLFNPEYAGRLGVGMASAELAITNPPGDGTAPDAVDDLTVDDVVGNAVSLSFTIPEDSEAPADGNAVSLMRVTGVDFRYSLDPITDETFGDAFPVDLGLDTVIESGEEVSVTVENLAFEQTYYFAVRSVDRFNNLSPLSNVAEATTGGAPFSVTPSSLEGELVAGTQASRALTITNESDRNVEFDLEIVGAAPPETEFAPSGLSGEKLASWKAANARAWGGDYPKGSDRDNRLAVDPRSAASDRNAAPARPSLQNTALNIAARSYNLFSVEFGYGAFDLGTPGTWDLINGDVPEIWAADYARGVSDRIFAYALDTVEPSNNVFGSIDVDTGVFTPIGDGWDHTGFPLDMTGDLTTGDLYVYTSENEIYTVDRFTGETTFVVAAPESDGVNTVAIDDMGVMFGHDVFADQIVTIDLATGDVTDVGPTGFDANFVQGMDFDPSTGRLYLSAYNNGLEFGTKAELRIASRTTGNTVLVQKINGDGYGEYPFLAIPGEGFLTTNLVGVELRPGRSVDVDVTLDATNLLAGDYSAAIRVVAAGLPGEPTVDVPVSLTVTGDPVAVVAPDALDFGEVFVNGKEVLGFTILNDGVDALDVSSIESDNGSFMALGNDLDETAFMLEPGESATVRAQFMPSELGPQSGTLTVTTNDPASPTFTIALSGSGIPAPEIAVAPTEFDLQAYAGQTYTRTFEISNTGGNPLTYLINEQDVTTTAVESVTLLEEAFEDGFPTDWTVVTNGDPNVPWQLASDYGAPTAPNYASTGDAAMANSDLGQFLGGPSFDTEMWTPAIAMEEPGFTLEYKVNFQEFLGGDFLDVDITTDGGATWTTMIQYTEDTCGNPDLGCFTPPNGKQESIPLDGFANVGDTFQVRWHFYTLDDPSWEWWATIDDVAIVRNVEWLSTTPVTGEIAPGESETITLTINADLPAGQYGADLLITSNDPLSSGEFVDIDLTVIESVTVSPTPGDDDTEVHPNESFLLPITVASLQDLGVESFQFTLEFDEELLEATGVVMEGSLSEGTSVSTNTDVPGEISVAVAEGSAMTNGGAPVLFTVNAADISGDNPVLIYVAMKAKETLGDSDLAFSEFQFNEGEPPVTGSVGSVSIVPLYGDVSLNVEVSSFDASLVLDAVVDAVELNNAAQVAADVSGNGDVSALDASLILRNAAGDDDVACFPVDASCATSPAVAALREAGSGATTSSTGGLALTEDLAWGTPRAVELANDAARSANGTLQIPLVLDASGPVYALDFEVEIDPALATVTAMDASLPNGWLATHSVSDGMLRIAFSGATPLANGTIASVTLQRHQPDAPLSLGGQARFDETTPVRVSAISAETPPMEFALRGNFPNPTAGAAVISVDLPEDASVRVEVYDAIGRRVLLIEDELKAGARQAITVPGRELPAGVYVYRVFAELDGGTKSAGGRLTVVR